MSWIILASLVALSYGAYNFFIKLSSSHINQIAGAVILQFVAFIAGLVGLVYLKTNDYPIRVTHDGIRYAVCAGVFVGSAEILSFYFFSSGATAARGIPIIIGGSILVGALLSLMVLHEKLNVSDWVGIFLIVAGVIVLTVREHML